MEKSPDMWIPPIVIRNREILNMIEKLKQLYMLEENLELLFKRTSFHSERVEIALKYLKLGHHKESKNQLNQLYVEMHSLFPIIATLSEKINDFSTYSLVEEELKKNPTLKNIEDSDTWYSFDLDNIYLQLKSAIKLTGWWTSRDLFNILGSN